MSPVTTPPSPIVLLRITDGRFHTHRAFCDFRQAAASAEAYAGAGYFVAMISATGRMLLEYDPPRGGPGVAGFGSGGAPKRKKPGKNGPR